MDIKKKIKENVQFILSIAAITGVVFNIFNFYILTKLSPLERRVDAVEEVQEANLPYVIDYIKFKTGVAKDIEEIKKDVDALVRVHGIKNDKE